MRAGCQQLVGKQSALAFVFYIETVSTLTLTPFDNSTALTREVNQGKEGQPRMLQALLSSQVLLQSKLEALQRESTMKTQPL